MATVTTFQRISVDELDSLQDAFGAVMDHVDKFVRPSIEISAVSVMDTDAKDEGWKDMYVVTVYGTPKVGEDDAPGE